MKRITFGVGLFLVAALFAFAGGSKEQAGQPAAASGGKVGGSTTVLGPWGGSELDIFNNMIKPFEDKTGIQVQYEGTRDADAILTTRVAAGNPPDVADFSNPGKMREFANEGKLVDLSGVLDMSAMKQQYAQGWIDLGTVDGKLVGVIVKAALKGLIWYDPKNLQAAGLSVPTTWDQLMSESQQLAAKGTTPWTVGLESGSASGWPGTDWLEIIFLKKYGPELYNQWWQGKLPWTSPQVKDVFQTWGKIVAAKGMSYGGSQYILSTNFGSAFAPLFQNPPQAYFFLQATFIQSFIQKQFPNLKAGEDFNFFGFPSINPAYGQSVETAGDLAGMFNKTPQSAAFVKYLTTPDAQAYWVKANDGISPNREVPISDYPDALSQGAAKVLTSAKYAVFDASDQMPGKMNDAFFAAILNYVSNPDQLDSILAHLDQVRQQAYSN